MVPQGLQAAGTTNPVGVPSGLQRVIPGKKASMLNLFVNYLTSKQMLGPITRQPLNATMYVVFLDRKKLSSKI